MRRQERGHAMLELAISAGVMVSCLVGTFQFGYTFYTYNQLVTAVGNGARYAAQRTYRSGKRGRRTRQRSHSQHGGLWGPATRARLRTGGSEADARSKWTCAGILAGDGAPVNVNVAIKGYTMDAIFRSFTFDGRPAVEFPYRRQVRARGA